MSDQFDAPVTETDLADFDEVYKDADASEDEFESVADGKYQTEVDRVELVRTSKGDPMLKWTLRVLGPTCEGRLLWRYNVMASDENIRWLKKDLYACGIRLVRLSELPANLERLLDIKLNVTKKTRGDFESVYINGLIKTAGETGKSAGKAKGKAKTGDALAKF
jgi:hypothetical protein